MIAALTSHFFTQETEMERYFSSQKQLFTPLLFIDKHGSLTDICNVCKTPKASKTYGIHLEPLWSMCVSISSLKLHRFNKEKSRKELLYG